MGIPQRPHTDNQHRRVSIFLGHAVKQIHRCHSVDIRHHKVEGDELRAQSLEQSQPFSGVRGLADHIASQLFKVMPQPSPCVRGIVNYEGSDCHSNYFSQFAVCAYCCREWYEIRSRTFRDATNGIQEVARSIRVSSTNKINYLRRL